MATNVRFLVLLCLFSISSVICQNDNTTTTSSPTTTAAPPSNSAPTPVPRNTDVAVCTCDLTANGCDVNCCCDPDCTSDDRDAFSRCDEAVNVVDTQACVQSKIMFSDNTPYVVNDTVPGLFCVQFDNYNERNYYDPPTIITDEAMFDEYSKTYGGSSFTQDTTQQSVSTDFYRSGDPIYTVYDVTDAVGYLGLSMPLVSAECADTNPAAYLYSQYHECTRPITDLAAECSSNLALSAATYYLGFSIITSPKAFDTTVNGTEFVTQDPFATTEVPVVTDAPTEPAAPLYNSSYALPIMPRGPHTCSDGLGLNTTCDFPPDSLPTPSYMVDPATGVGYCTNTVVKVMYTIQYNGTEGINYVGVTFTFKTLTADMLPSIQAFQTQFTQDADANDTLQRSGNPGYQTGQPILAGYLLETQTDDVILQAIELDTNRDNWLTMVTSQANGRCAVNDTDRVSVTFGVAMRSGCLISVSFDNISDVCSLIRETALTALRGPNPPGYVATFGNTSVDSVGDWVEILDDAPSSVQDSGVPGECNNVVTGLHIEFIYANVGALANPQAKIIGASFRYQEQAVLRYQCVGPYCQPGNEAAAQLIEVVNSVGFVDASQSAIPVSAEKPRVTARLPEDFFYPFS